MDIKGVRTMQQLDIFTVEQPVTNGNATGFKYRKRLYNENDNYLYTAIPTEQGYRLVPVSIYLKGEQLFYLTTEDYKQFIAVRNLIEVIPKDVEARL